ncbi:unnamed protein product [Laminaria digitata]
MHEPVARLLLTYSDTRKACYYDTLCFSMLTVVAVEKKLFVSWSIYCVSRCHRPHVFWVSLVFARYNIPLLTDAPRAAFKKMSPPPCGIPSPVYSVPMTDSSMLSVPSPLLWCCCCCVCFSSFVRYLLCSHPVEQFYR